MKKKLLCLLLCVPLLTAATPLCPQICAADSENVENAYPVILLPGLLENLLVQPQPDGSQKTVWFSFGNVARVTLRYGLKILYTIYHGTDEEIASLTNKVIREAAGGIRMNPDGTSALEGVQPVVTRAEDCTYNALKKAGLLRKVTYGPTMLKALADRVGGDRAFVFQYDWRMSPIDIAKDLHAFIQDVKRMTGSEKVNACGTSFGSEILLAYLRDYGEGGELHHVVMNSPAYGGSVVFKEMMAAESLVHIDYESLLRMILCNYGVEAELGYLLRIIPHDVIDKIFDAAVRDFVQNDFVSSVGFWGCCAQKDYDEMKALFLDPVKNAAVIEKTDEMQYELMAKTREIVEASAQYGTQVYSIMNEGCVLFTNRDSGDVLVDAASGTGGICLAVGSHFPADYTPEHIVCRDETHNHVSYTGSIDLTNCYMPETTWVFYGQMHGQNWADTRARALTLRLLTTDDILNVYSDPAFPQFMENAAAVSDLSLTLKDSPQTILHPQDGAVEAVVTNHSSRRFMRVRAIEFEGVPYKASKTAMLLRPGESRTVTLTPTGSTHGRYGSITIRYDEVPNLKVHKARTQYAEIL